MMKRICLSLIAVLFVTGQAHADLIAYWNFNDFDPDTDTTINANAGVGNGVLSLADWDGTLNNFEGTTLNALFDNPAGASLSLIAGSDLSGNDSFITFSFDMSGFQDLEVSYATRGTSTGFTTQTWSWSMDGNTFTDFATETGRTDTSYSVLTLDPLTALDNISTAFLRVTFSGGTGPSGNNRLDNIQFNASVIPEPGTGIMVLMLVGATCLAAGRRRRD